MKVIVHKLSSVCCKCFILNIKENMQNLIPKLMKAFFLGYYTTSKASRVYTKLTVVIEESTHVVVNESIISLKNCENYVEHTIERELFE